MNPKRLLPYLLVVVSLVAAACVAPTAQPQVPAAQPAAETPAAPAPSGEAAEVHYLTVQQENEGWPLIIGGLTSDFQADHPNVTWKYENYPQTDLVQRIQLLAGSNNLPFMFNYESGAPLRDLVASGQVLDLEKTFQDLGIYEELNPGAVSLLKGLVDNAGLYALPLELNVEGFWYNKQMFLSLIHI
jgi:raffinose/stachyose/melibiose transport system substrate-binding protein